MFSDVQVDLVAAPGTSSTPAAVDLDDDGDYDLVFGEDSGTLNYFVNNGSPTSYSFSESGSSPFEGISSTTMADTAPTFADMVSLSGPQTPPI